MHFFHLTLIYCVHSTVLNSDSVEFKQTDSFRFDESCLLVVIDIQWTSKYIKISISDASRCYEEIIIG